MPYCRQPNRRCSMSRMQEMPSDWVSIHEGYELSPRCFHSEFSAKALTQNWTFEKIFQQLLLFFAVCKGHQSKGSWNLKVRHVHQWRWEHWMVLRLKNITEESLPPFLRNPSSRDAGSQVQKPELRHLITACKRWCCPCSLWEIIGVFIRENRGGGTSGCNRNSLQCSNVDFFK